MLVRRQVRDLHVAWCVLVVAGVIVNAELPPDKRPRLQGAAFNGPPTQILVLRNMVGPGEVDEDLEEEVGGWGREEVGKGNDRGLCGLCGVCVCGGGGCRVGTRGKRWPY